jgi:hypothetical protein
MKPFYNTPQLHNPPFESPRKTGKDLIYHLEDKISNYLDDCEKGYCALDKTVLSGLHEELEVAHKSSYHPVCQVDDTWLSN